MASRRRTALRTQLSRALEVDEAPRVDRILAAAFFRPSRSGETPARVGGLVQLAAVRRLAGTGAARG